MRIEHEKLEQRKYFAKAKKTAATDEEIKEALNRC